MSSPPAFDKAISLTNRCGESKSPYVRSHLANPTAWQLWSPETLELARNTNRLLFVSIGYSACHWCHVMAHESFDDPRIAQLLNEHFIPIKIDREERPDIDRQYMDFLQATSGSGGWPLNVFVTPELEPLFGGTYWPGPKSGRTKMGGTTFEDVLRRVLTAWKEQEAKCRQNASEITRQLREYAQEGMLGGKDGKPDENDGLELDLLDDAYQHYKGRFDPKFGGFGGAPKFPTPVHIRPLLRVASYPSDVREIVGEDECVEARRMAVKTLESMAKGGIKDQIGHGFARYSVTRDWSLPHFEKMLYDNAQLLPVYLDAYLLTKSPLLLDTVHDIAKYLTSPPMSSPLGGINASEDADSLATASDHHKREGAYYVWTMEEFNTVLGDSDAKVCAAYWGVKQEGNVERRFDVQGELIGQNTLCVQCEFSELAAKFSMEEEEEVKRVISEGRQKLLAHRERTRPRPALDDKIVTSWNGMAIGGLARASSALQYLAPAEAATYLDGAVKAVECIQQHLFDTNTGTLKRVYREGPGPTPGFADDYAFLIAGLLDLYEATWDSQWLEFADKLQQTQIKLFWDEEKYGFFSTPANQPDILIRVKDAMDNAEPSINGVSAHNLFRMGSLLNDETYEKLARKVVACFEVEIGQHPGLFSGMLASVVAAKNGMRGLVVVGDGELAEQVLQKMRDNVWPISTALRVGGGVNDSWLRSRNTLLKDIDTSKPMVQLCHDGVCKLLSAEDLEALFKA
ncbi:related to DUF255 domain protein [Ramularia collo-cygni]|uniref:Related to DUF255 domain protein n=1 Tax=Ramularia collo-cygni TaxID=112498 RepID=A0A2D3VBG2_9PEZI|nr:related to DUF255 domain protein [Ramularia collo-cygni]CZT20044.1 related to DUF255 domain protein [Ramularia collo-cygni]